MFLYKQKQMKNLSQTAQTFILHWGEMGTKWGINRTVAQIHALLFISERPLDAAEICDTLGVARSNVSNSLKELQIWGIVKVVHLPGDRRDHFQSMKDVYEMFRVIAAERKRREIDPTLALLRDCLEPTSGKDADPYARRQLRELQGFFEVVTRFYDTMNRLPTKRVVQILNMGDKLLRLLARGAK